MTTPKEPSENDRASVRLFLCGIGAAVSGLVGFVCIEIGLRAFGYACGLLALALFIAGFLTRHSDKLPSKTQRRRINNRASNPTFLGMEVFKYAQGIDVIPVT